jgi:hypothetical protein
MIYTRGYRSKKEWKQSLTGFISGLSYFEYDKNHIVTNQFSNICSQFKKQRGVDLFTLHQIISMGWGNRVKLHKDRTGNLVYTSSLINPI